MSEEFEPNPEAMRRISAHLWGEDMRNIRAAVESFPNGYTVVPKEAISPVPEVMESLRRHRSDGNLNYQDGELCVRCARPWPCDAAQARAVLEAQREPTAHEHEWQPAGVTEALGRPDVTYVWGMCKCGEIMLRQWDS